MADETLASFPTYAELTQTRAWAAGAPVPIATAIAGATASQSQASRYTEGSVLGVGGMGKVVLARDARIGREVALKMLHTELELAEPERLRFLREAQVQGQLEHPSIVPVYDIDYRPDGTTFFTMRRVLGRTLQAILEDLRIGNAATKARHTQRELLQSFATVCLTIDYAHSRGVVHRDLKPANIMLGDFGEVYVLDWGLARIVEHSNSTVPATQLSAPGAFLGTPLYMAPEQMAEPDVGPAADVYALGAILFEILTLQHVRDPRALYVPVDARPSVRAPDRNIAPELETICVRATQLIPFDRYGSARAVQDAVARYLEGDRELEQRRTLAAIHADKAAEALRNASAPGADHEQERTVAIRELGRALALDPTDKQHVAMFAKLMSTLPKLPPPEVVAMITTRDRNMVRAGAAYSAAALLGWFLLFPMVLLMGIRRIDYVLAIVIPVLVAASLALIVRRQRVVRRPLQYLCIGCMMIAMMSLSRILGPLILMPTAIATTAIVAQAHSDRRMRNYSLASAAVAMVVPLALEWLGILPPSYMFEGGRLHVLPQLVELPQWLSVGFVTISNLAMTVIPALFVAKLRHGLTVLEEQSLMQTWQFRQLPDDLMRATSR